MKLALVIPVINRKDETIACLQKFKNTATHWQDVQLLIIDNGSEVPVLEWGIEGLKESQVIRNEQNIGVLPAMQQAYKKLCPDADLGLSEILESPDYIFFTHNDVEMYEPGWDEKIIRVLEGVNAGLEKGVGVAGFFGAKGIGTSELYHSPYQMHQLVRVDNVSGCHRMPPGHMYRPPRGEWEQVAVMDGFSLIVSRKFLEENIVEEDVLDEMNQLVGVDKKSGFDLNLPPHHMYDAHTCLQAMDLGYMNIVISMDALHRGGMTDVQEEWNTPFGKTKSEIHQEAHYPYFYEYWRNGRHGRVKLPVYVQ